MSAKFSVFFSCKNRMVRFLFWLVNFLFFLYSIFCTYESVFKKLIIHFFLISVFLRKNCLCMTLFSKKRFIHFLSSFFPRMKTDYPYFSLVYGALFFCCWNFLWLSYSSKFLIYLALAFIVCVILLFIFLFTLCM